MRIFVIAAIANNGAMGRNGRLPWRCPEDLERFRDLTLGKVVLMGRKTAESLRRALPGRVNLVLTRDASWSREGFITVGSHREVAELNGEHDVWVIGGADLYAYYLPMATIVHLTVLDRSVPDADTFFPMAALSGFVPRVIEPGQDPSVTFFSLVRPACMEFASDLGGRILRDPHPIVRSDQDDPS